MASKNNSNTTRRGSKFRTNYDADYKSVVVKYALQTSNKAASDHFGINESNVRRWKRLSLKAEFLENTIGRRALTKKTRVRRKTTGKSRRRRKKTTPSNSVVDQQESSSDIDSMPLQQRLTSIATTETLPEPEKPNQTLKSQPLSPTKLKVTRQSTRPQQPKPEEIQQPVREEICLKWNTHHSNMQTAFPALLNKEQYCDVTLVAEGISLKCHKLILSSCSSYFDEVLEKVTPYQHPIIFMKDIPFNIMRALCDFMYVGEVNIVQKDLDQILAVGESLKIKGLASKSGTGTNEPQKPSVPEKNDPAKDVDITDPLDLMEPTYEEAATPDDPPPVLKRNDQARKSTGRRIRKRKHVEVDHEPSPPVFRLRKGTRSRPNVKVPRYFNANFDNSVTTPVDEPPEESNEAEEAVIDPYMNILEQIKTEPLDIEDGFITFEEETFNHEMSSREPDIEQYDPGPEIQETKKPGRRRRMSRVAKRGKKEKPDPLNIDCNMEETPSESIEKNTDGGERLADNYITENDTHGMEVENSEREEMETERSDEVENREDEMLVENTNLVENQLENSDRLPEGRNPNEIHQENIEQDENNKTQENIDNENSVTDKTQVESREKEEMQGENSDFPEIRIENSYTDRSQGEVCPDEEMSKESKENEIREDNSDVNNGREESGSHSGEKPLCEVDNIISENCHEEERISENTSSDTASATMNEDKSSEEKLNSDQDKTLESSTDQNKENSLDETSLHSAVRDGCNNSEDITMKDP